MKKRILALVLSTVLLMSTAALSAAAAPKAPKIKGITVAANGKSATVKWNKVKSAKGYQIKYGYTKKLKKATTKNVAKSKKQIKLKKLKAGKTLYVKIRAKYKSGKKTKFTKYSAVKSVKLAMAQVAPTTTEAPATVAPTTAQKPTEAPSTEAPTTQVPENPIEYSMTELEDSLRIIGRAGYLYNNFVCDWTNSGFELGMDCRGDIKLKFKLSGSSALLGVVIDEDFDNMHVLKIAGYAGFSEVTVDTNMQSGYHKIRVIKLNEFNSNGFIFSKFTVDGTPAEKPAAKDLKLEFIGDSITCGAGNLGYIDSNEVYCQDGSKTYAAVLSQRLGADSNIISRSAWGLRHNWQGNEGEVLPNIYRSTYPLSSGSVEWDFAEYQPDIVFINLGQNDSTAMALGYKQTTADEFKESALAFCNTIREKNPDCKIVWLEGMMDPYNAAFADGVKAALAELEDTYYCVLPSGKSGIGSHPNVAEHAAAAEVLYDFLVEQELIKE